MNIRRVKDPNTGFYVWVFCFGTAVVQLMGEPATFADRKDIVQAAVKRGFHVLDDGRVLSNEAPF